MSPSGDSKPFVLVASHTLSGHIVPMSKLAAGLAAASWPVFFLGPTAHRARIEATGATFIPLTGAADGDDQAYYRAPPTAGYGSLPWRDRVLVDLQTQCIEPLPAQWRDLCAALQQLAALDRARRVVVLCDGWFFGALPLRLGAALPDRLPRPRSVCVAVTALALRSVDAPPPCGHDGLPSFDASGPGRERNAAAWARWEVDGRCQRLTRLLADKLAEAGAVRPLPGPFLSGGHYTAHDGICDLTLPSFEYPRSDWPPGFTFTGLVQRRPAAGWHLARPSFDWWHELEANSALGLEEKQRKKVCVVAQGTIGVRAWRDEEVNPRDLMIPTMSALANRSDVLVVAILGWKKATMADAAGDFVVPANARVADYLSYDAVLQHADVWINNAGLGAIHHGISHGVPMVVAGEGQDKTENARRVADSGIGLDLCTATPSVEAVGHAVGTMLDPAAYTRYRDRVTDLQRESEGLDMCEIVGRELERIARLDVDEEEGLFGAVM